MCRDLYIGRMAKTIDPERFRAKPRRGRPPIGGKPMTQITLRMTDELLEAVDAVIEDREGQTDRGSVIREYLAKGFKAG